MDDIPYINVVKTTKGVVYLGKVDDKAAFESHYLNVREKEGRLFSDQFVKGLPYLPESHPLHHEWLHRAATMNMFIKYLNSKNDVNSILDLGCGNGWFSNQMHLAKAQANIYGLDVNSSELRQAGRLFAQQKLAFLHGDIFQDIFLPDSFDIIVLNSSAQYFPNLHILLKRLLLLLKAQGEIHILDTPFYKSATQQKEAGKRSEAYFIQMGVPEMLAHYFHHPLAALQSFSTTVRYQPNQYRSTWMRMIGKKSALFPWISIRKP